MYRLRELAERTPAGRERYIDLLRAIAITAVVCGHWLAIVIVYDAQGLGGFSVLGALPWTHALTWLFQVMPVFFLVGGFANAVSLTKHRDRGNDAIGWLLARSGRLVRPTTALLATLGGAALAARLFGVDPDLVGTAVWLAAIPLWFLAAYLAVVLLTPVMHALHRRFGIAVPLLLVGLVAVGDVARLRHGLSVLATANFLLVPLAAYQIGFAWQDGRLRARPRTAVPLLLGGFTALLLLTVFGPYPISMINVPGATVQNASPPTLALLALATSQLGLVLLLRDRGERWLRGTAAWTAVIAANSIIMTVFLWHMSAVIPAVVILHLGGLLPAAPVGSAAWLLWKLPWLALLCLILAGLVAVFGRIETGGVPQPVARSRWIPAAVAAALARPRPQAAAAVAGYSATTLGLLGIATAGRADHGQFGLSTTPLLAFLAGAAILRLARSVQPESRSTRR